MNLRRMQYQSAHMELLRLRHWEADNVGKEYLNTLMLMSAPFGETYTIDGRIIGMCGIIAVHPGVVNGHIIPSIYTKQYMFHFHREILRRIVDWERGRLFHRIQTCSHDDPQTNRWMEMLGFTCEGTMRQFSSNKEDFKQWARLSNGTPKEAE